MTDPNSRRLERELAPTGPPGVPRWVKISGALVAVILLVLVVIMVLGGNHGPGRHMGAPVAKPSTPAVALARARLEGSARW